MDPLTAKIAIVVALAVACAAVLVVAWWWTNHEVTPQHESFSEEELRRLGGALGLDEYAERDYFGERVQVVSGFFEELYVELEISAGAWPPYLRVVVKFPTPLAQDITVLSEEPGTVVNKLRRLQEIEIEEPAFDEQFLLFAASEKRLRRFFPASTRFQMIQLNRAVDEFRLGDQTLFVFSDHPCDRDEIRSVFKKSVELADRLYRTAEELGPAPTLVDVTSYEESVEEKIAGSITEMDHPTASRND